ncbi:MAG TPA: hypothetical protein VGC66_05505 [Pyrinomonadaceae bacterium]
MRFTLVAVVSIFAVLLITTHTTANSNLTTVPRAFVATIQGAYTPPPASAERKAILDAYRAKWKQSSGITNTDVVFVVSYLKVHNSWAWLDVRPQSSDGSQQYEGEQGLLRKKSGTWRVLERTAGYDTEYFRKLKKKYPSVPTDIFPEP